MSRDEELERAIDEVGRERVFERAREYGWEPGSFPPKYVWAEIVQELRAPLTNPPLGE